MNTLHIKNMVCDRCRAAVQQTLRAVGLEPVSVELGTATVAAPPSPEQLEQLRQRLSGQGFELLGDRREQTVDRIRSLIVELVHRQNSQTQQRLSDWLASQMHADYSALSKLFSELTGNTIESYYVRQRVERVKELLSYGELTLSQISVRLGYSSVAYLSTQFKQVTGITPTAFKTGLGTRQPLDRV